MFEAPVEAPVSATSKTILHCALELSKSCWLLAIQYPDRSQPSQYRIKGGDAEGLMAQLLISRQRCAKSTGEVPSIVLCYEVGYDAFWLARFLIARGVECLVVDPASLQVNRRGRRAKTDRIDVGMLLRALIGWCRGERHVWSVVHVPSVDEEDVRRSHRERGRLIHELSFAGANHVSAHRGTRFSLAELALQAAIDGAGVVLGRMVLAEGDLAAGRLVRPFNIFLPLDVSYFLVMPRGSSRRQEIQCFRDWLYSRVKQSPFSRNARKPA